MAAGIDCEPGLLQKPFGLIEENARAGEPDVVILVDKMGIRKDIRLESKKVKFIGNVDYGYIKEEKIDNIATNALLITVSGLKKLLRLIVLSVPLSDS